MLIQVGNLPSGITQVDLEEMFDCLDCLDHISLIDSPNPGHAIALIALNCSQCGAAAISRLIDGHYYRGRNLSAYMSLFAH